MNPELIENALLDMGVPPCVKGFKAIVLSACLLDSTNFGIMTIYATVAKATGSTPVAIERAVRRTLAMARDCRAGYDAVEKYIGFVNLSNSASLALLLFQIHREQHDTVYSQVVENGSIISWV